TEPKLRLKPSTEPKLDPGEVAKALGAEPASGPPYLFANFPEDPAHRSTNAAPPNPLGLRPDEWDKLCALAAELGEGEATPTPLQVARAIVRRALVALSPGKPELLASVTHEPEASPRK